MYLDGTDGDNFGPHCRNCHSGASSCEQCHGATGGARTTTVTAPVAGTTAFVPNAYVKTSAVVDVNSQCVDGGFSWPHRTLGANLLKDEIYGVDFDGAPIAFGQVRSAQASAETTFGASYFSTSWNTEQANANADTSIPYSDSTLSIAGAAAENLDSVCIDCHGDGTYWNGDDPTNYYKTGADGAGWELILKGLP